MWTCPWVYLGRSGLTHIAEQHPDVTDFDLLHLPMAIARGLIVRLEKSPRKILAAYKAEHEKIYLCAMKAAQDSTEIWVDSFYRIKPGKFDNLSRKGTVLRSHK